MTEVFTDPDAEGPASVGADWELTGGTKGTKDAAEDPPDGADDAPAAGDDASAGDDEEPADS